MSPRFLFGPVTAAFAEENLHGPRQTGQCLAFNATGDADLALRPGDTWNEVCARLPESWRPDFVVLYLPYTTIPECLWSAPLPLVGLAADWNLLWHGFRPCLARCERVLTDTAGVEALAGAGLSNARAANLFGLERAFLESPRPDVPRDIDILFVGNRHPAVQRERLAWLGRLARLADRWRVVLAAGVFGDDYRQLLARSRIVFNRSIRGEWNRRVGEVLSAGCLLFQEASNREVAAGLRDRHHYVAYNEDNVEALLEYYLLHEEERHTLAEAGRARAASFGFEVLWAEQVAQIASALPDLGERVPHRPAPEPEHDLQARTWQALGSGGRPEPALAADLAAALVRQPHAANLHNALGLVLTLDGQAGGPLPAARAEQATGYFRRALAHEPGHLVAGLNLVEALAATGQTSPAVEQARRLLAQLDRAGEARPGWLDAGHFPPGFDLFRVEWERAAWAHAGSPAAEARAKRDLLRWRLHALLADLTGDLLHYYEAAAVRPDLPSTQAALGCALARTKHPLQAVSHLRRAVTADPFDADAARALFHVLGEAGDADGQRRLARDRRLLHQAAPGAVEAEPWFVNTPPVGDELASIIVLCCNQLEYTRLCLESVRRCTRPPYELVLIDNGSTDGTAEYLEEVRQAPGPWRVVVLRNEHNVGFPAGCNQGLAQARGRYVVFLNNDTVLTEGWLEGLVRAALRDWPLVGLVGAVTNASRAPQQVPVDYRGLEGVEAFSARRLRDFAGQALEVERLTGFCLLARREVLERVGCFDERFGLGFFDDDDVCVRVRQAGFRLRVAQDVFVHHFGSRTFTALGVDHRQLLQENFERFRDKWGAAETVGYTLPPLLPTTPSSTSARRASEEAGTSARRASEGPSSLARRAEVPQGAGGEGKPRVSLCMIVKNEEANLADCLAGAADLVDEVVVVDTGSTDRTREIALRFGARVFDFAWVDNFAAARNESLRHASGDWVFWLDADDRLDEPNREKLRQLFAGLGPEIGAFVMQCLCPSEAASGATVVQHVRLFRNHPQMRWQHRVHEQILPAVRALNGAVHWTDLVIQHTGYRDPALRRRKLERDLRLLHLEEVEQPDHPFTLFNLGSVYLDLGEAARALPLLRRSLDLSHPADSITRKLYALLIQGHRQLGQGSEALAVCQQGRHHYAVDVELLFLEAQLRKGQGDYPGAEACLLRLLGSQEAAHFGSVDTGLRGYKARHQLALLYREQGRLLEAEAQWRAALSEVPTFLPGWLELGELHAGQQRWAELEETARRLEEAVPGSTEAVVLRARAQLGRREFATARALLEGVIAAAPQALWPRTVLSHVLLQDGKDLAAAERVLREILMLDPGNAQARHNLGVLLRA
jgi:GT2 family glycosyltransferase/tetratricopeptide (TPR) repeat protein